ncbi:MAG: adenylosuccinate synthetase [Euryarchaeota archaeon]|nr:adenylosuccinate synthetase [Euryarchaeota archaeon]
MGATVVVGGYFGDEGKGKVVAYLAQRDRVHIVARGGVGPNAGHTVDVAGEKHGVRMIPSGYAHLGSRLLVGTGVLVDPRVFLQEVETLKVRGRVGVDERCGVIEERHIQYEQGNEFMAKTIGSTQSGCGSANADRVLRIARLAHQVPELRDYLTDVPRELDGALRAGKNVLVEGTQGFGISLYYGTYPFVTSKDTSASQILADVGLGPTRVEHVVVIFKAFPTRVGQGPFQTEIPPEEAQKRGIEEYGTVTGRRRRVGLWDGAMARYSAMVNGATEAALTGLDKVDPSCRGAKRLEELSPAVKEFVRRAEADTGVPFTLLSTGPEVSEIIDLRNGGRR